MVEGPSTTSAVFIIESVDLADERLGNREGRILRDILRLSRKSNQYWYIRTKRELRRILAVFGSSGMRYLHISCHGDTEALYTTFDRIPFNELKELLRPRLVGRRLFISACEAANHALAKRIMPGSGCLSLIGPKGEIMFSDAAMMWASFYHLMFREGGAVMTRAEILRALEMIATTFEVPIRYFGRKKDGFNFSYQTIPPNKTRS